MAETVAPVEPDVEQSIHWMSPEETRAVFDAEARRLMGMGGEEFLRCYDAGDFLDVHDDGENVDFVDLELLIPWGR